MIIKRLNIFSKFKKSGEINKLTVKKYFNSTRSLLFSAESANREQDKIIDLLRNETISTILDLGCGDGRYSRVLPYSNYTGVDFAEKFIENLSTQKCKTEFICSDVAKFQIEKKYDLILMVGIITYLDDSDLESMLRNVKNMMHRDTVLLIRSIPINQASMDQGYFDSRRWMSFASFFKPRYQIVRRSTVKELGFFKDFKLIESQEIDDTSYIVYKFKGFVND